jgi:transaldolase
MLTVRCAPPFVMVHIYSCSGIVNIFKMLAPEFDTKRVCIKIPATWEGLEACRALETKGIATLATTMFCMEQATLAADAQCTYIAPYVNELKVHFEAG